MSFDPQEFGDRVRSLRHETGLSQSDVAVYVNRRGFNLHQTTVAKIERGVRSMTVPELVAFIAVLDASYLDLLPDVVAREEW